MATAFSAGELGAHGRSDLLISTRRTSWCVRMSTVAAGEPRVAAASAFGVGSCPCTKPASCHTVRRSQANKATRLVARIGLTRVLRLRRSEINSRTRSSNRPRQPRIAVDVSNAVKFRDRAATHRGFAVRHRLLSSQHVVIADLLAGVQKPVEPMHRPDRPISDVRDGLQHDDNLVASHDMGTFMHQDVPQLGRPERRRQAGRQHDHRSKQPGGNRCANVVRLGNSRQATAPHDLTHILQQIDEHPRVVKTERTGRCTTRNQPRSTRNDKHRPPAAHTTRAKLRPA